MLKILFKIRGNTSLIENERDFLRYKNFILLGQRTDLLVQSFSGYFLDNHKQNTAFIITGYICLRSVVL